MPFNKGGTAETVFVPYAKGTRLFYLYIATGIRTVFILYCGKEINMVTIPKGTKDILPSESYKWQYIERCARETAKLFNIKEIRTPVFEHTELFLRGVGDTTDIVNKEMYTFNDKGGRSITLKPEGTAGVARAFIESGLINGAMPVKMFYLTPVFRYERPQAGRLRQHHQFGIEIFGSYSPSVDAEVICVADTFFRKLGIDGLTVNINSIGCPNCRNEYNAVLRKYLGENSYALCPVCRERAITNPLRVLDCKDEECRKVIASAPKTTDFLCIECRNHFEGLQKYLKLNGINYGINTSIVRGLDYYTKTVFEFISNSLGAQSTVCGGGRYDNLIENIGGTKMPGAGFGMGIERLLLMMENMGVNIPEEEACRAYVAPIGAESYDYCFEILKTLRNAGISADIDHMERGIKAQLKFADKIKVEFVIAAGGDEIQSESVKIKNMKSGKEELIKKETLIGFIRNYKE
jgi:histidyl-tRNA synthetase